MDGMCDQIQAHIGRADGSYHRLILLVGQSGAGKSATLREIAKRTGAPVVNVNLELSRAMLELTEKQRSLQLSRLFEDLLAATGRDLVLLDNLEIVFSPALFQDPLRLLQTVSRNRTVVAAWNGQVDSGNLVYAEPDHPEFQHYPAKDLVIVAAPTTQAQAPLLGEGRR